MMIAAITLLVLLAPVIDVLPIRETVPVQSADDAADDPALWYNAAAPEHSLILGTDKKAGLAVYTLDGRQHDFLAVGRVNNVDVLQGVTLADWSGDLAAASNRTDDSITLFSVSFAATRRIGTFSVAPEPYGFCMGRDGDAVVLFVAHKQGYVQPYRLLSLSEPPVALPPLYLSSQIEGCVYDRFHKTLHVGEEEKGIWAVPFAGGMFDRAGMTLVDTVGGATGLAADVEGVTLYEKPDGQGYLVASSQGDDTYHLYDRSPPYAFAGKIRIAANRDAAVDGAQETDGIAAISVSLGVDFPLGLLIVQDGFNVGQGDLAHDGRTADETTRAAQNFKIVDWRTVEAALAAPRE